jgi:hypothetical protein
LSIGFRGCRAGNVVVVVDEVVVVVDEVVVVELVEVLEEQSDGQ